MPRSPSPGGAASCCRGGPRVPPGHYHTADNFTGRAETVREGALTQGTALAGPGWQALPQRAGWGRRTAPHRVRGAAAAAGSEVMVWPARRAAGGGWAAAGGGWASTARPSSSSSSRRLGSCTAITAPRRGGSCSSLAPAPQKRPAVRGRRLVPMSWFSFSRISSSFWYICGRRAEGRNWLLSNQG